MEFLLLALFFISVLIFFIAGKDDFGRTESKLIIKEKENINKVVEEGKKEDMVAEEVKKEDMVAKEGNIEPKEELKKES